MTTTKNDDDLAMKFNEMTVDANDVNILLLGETGIGKSTFINAFTNYLHYKSFDLAERNDVQCLVPAKFEITDDEDGQFKKKIISIGEDCNENTSITSAATQNVRSYVFPLQTYNNRKFRLIDTPGICDDRGIEQDQENLESILSYIGRIEHLHAICILLKPNNARLTVAFQYCITQLLSRLEKSASSNIVFVFTNSRSTFYKPGDTSAAIIKVLDLIAQHPPHVKIKFEKENVFCLDNEAFRYLAASKQKVKLAHKSSFVDSWKHSEQECHRLIKYVIGDGPTKIAPHQVSKTISVNKARQVIIELSKPLADITENINDNMQVLQKHRKTLQLDYTSIEELKARLYVPVINLEQIECPMPKTVCGNSKCCETIAVGDLKKQHYKQKCHNPCYLQNIPREIIGDKGLRQCAAMNGQGQCKECGCDFSAHLHIYYETKTVQDKIEGSGVKAQITDRQTAAKEMEKIIRDIERRKNEFDAEKHTIVKAMAKFAHFLERNAISPFNDSYKTYIEYLIKRENSRGPDCNQETILQLEKLLKQYNEERQILEDALKRGPAGSNTNDITPDIILKQIKELYSLPHVGNNIRNLHKMQKRGETAEHRNTEFLLQNADPYDSSSSYEGNRGRGNRGKGRGRGNSRGRGNNRMNTVHNENKFKNNMKNRPQPSLYNNVPNYWRGNPEIKRNLQQQMPPYNNAPNFGGYNQNYPNQSNMQQSPYHANYYQEHFPNPQYNMGYNNPMNNYQNRPPSLMNMNLPPPNNGWNQNPNQQYQGPHPAQNLYEKSRSSPKNNSETPEPNYNKNSFGRSQSYPQENFRNPEVHSNKLDISDECYDLLYGSKKKQNSAGNQTKKPNKPDSDSDNESSSGFEKFRKRKGLDNKHYNYEDLYGDDDNDDEKSTKGKGFFNTMKNIFN